MKTSNKLLIAFTATLIVLPVLVMAFVSKMYYTDAKNWADLEKQNETFDGKSENMEAIPLNQFNAINIADGKETGFYIHLVKDKKFGVKVAKSEKEFIKFGVDKDGRLQINLNPKNEKYNYIELFVYAPETSALSANNISDLELKAKGNTLALNLKKFMNLKFHEASLIQKLSINAENGYTNIEENAIAKSIYLNLKNANFRSDGVSFEDLDITAIGNSRIDVFGGYDTEKKYTIRNLTLKTIDSAEVTFRSIDIKKAKGSLSDQTTVLLPVINLKQMLK
ncbi:MAG: hypothetical protein EOO98_00235 [Pedobacter sp.]|nr:MAG: hypothetical protein EOO98_00235 [Pedobacter sp.]